MGAANTDYIQATIELFGAVVCVVVAFMLRIITGNKKKSEHYLLHLLAAVCIALITDAGWYIFDGDASLFGRIANRFCNMAIFLCMPAQLLFALNFIKELLREEKKEPKKAFSFLVIPVLLGMVLIAVTNPVTGWMYGFSAGNVYARHVGWYVYTMLGGVAILMMSGMLIFHRKGLAGRKRLTLHIFLLSPFVGIALQFVNLGISFIQLGIAFGILMVFLTYINDWLRKERKKNKAGEGNENFWLIECVFLVMMLCVSTAIVSCVLSVDNVSKKNSKQSSTSLAQMVYETVGRELEEPIHVSRVLADSPLIRAAVSEEHLEGSELEKQMLEYMRALREDYNYQMVFVASVKTKAFYTYEGLSRYMDVKHDVKDAWYQDFVDKKVRYELNVDTDKDNNMGLGIFVNMSIYDGQGELVGICGVAMPIGSLIDTLRTYENQYNLDATLVNKNGVIQVDTDWAKIEHVSVDPSILEGANSQQFTYQLNVHEARLVQYLDGSEWYLIVEDRNPNKLNVFFIILPSLIIYLIGLVLMILLIGVFSRNEKHRTAMLREKKRQAERDGMTGLYNRYAYEMELLTMREEGFPEQYSIVMLDVNGLKTVNDTIGHTAGDELIIGAANCIRTAFERFGKVYRTGGDEFMVIACGATKEVEACAEELERITEKWRGKEVAELAISCGIASNENFPGMSYGDLEKQADKLMYEAKSEYYRRTGKDRRTR